MSEVFSERAKLSCSVGFERLEMKLRCRELSSYRAYVLQVSMEDALAICGWSLNDKVVLKVSAVCLATESDLLRDVSVLLSISLQWFLLYQIIGLLKHNGVIEPFLDRVKFVATNLLAYSARRRGWSDGRMVRKHGTAAEVRARFCQNFEMNHLGPVARYL